MFLKVDRDKKKRKGSVYVAKVGTKVIAGRTSKLRLSDIALDIAIDYVKGRELPSISVMLVKRTSNTVTTESKLHAMLMEYEHNGSYELEDTLLKELWETL